MDRVGSGDSFASGFIYGLVTGMAMKDAAEFGVAASALKHTIPGDLNHATLAGHTFTHELQVAADAGLLGSIDANRGDYQNGWDTDQFPNNHLELAEAMLVILEAGGFGGGGINFDAKIRRNSTDPADLFYAHIGAMDNFARALVAAHDILEHSDYRVIRASRYASFDSGAGKEYEEGKLSLEQLRQLALTAGEPEVRSGRQEFLENLINRFV